MNKQTLFPPIQPVELCVIEALRDATRSHHAQLGASPAMSRLFDTDYTLHEYRAHLARLLGLFEPLKYAVACASDPTNPARSLERTSALRDDLATMGATAREIEGLERCSWLPSISPAGLYGYAYVVLGSIKGAKIIVKRLRSVLGPAASFHFYGRGTESSDALWSSFCCELEANGKENVEIICATAVGVFEAYATWLSDPLRQPSNG
jgi:heme oxygenase (biliverdin-IX-beta and delta-forming)